MPLIESGKLYTPPTSGLLVLTAKADAGATIADIRLHVSADAQIVGVFGKKENLVPSLLEVRVIPDGDVWDGEGIVLGGSKIVDTELTLHYQEPAPLSPPGFLLLRSTGVFTQPQYITVVIRANNASSGF